MAQATGTIDFSSAPAQYAKITVSDGTGDGFGQVTFVVTTTTGAGTDALSGSAALNDSNNLFNGNASKALTLYQNASTNKSFMYISFGLDGQGAADFRDMATGGSTPLIYEFTDASGNVLNVTLVNESSGYTPTVGSGTNNGRKDSAGNYSLNTNLNLSAANIAESLKLILNAAKSDGEINITTASRDSTNFLNFRTAANDTSDGPLKFRIKRASGSWASTAVVAAHISKDDSSASGHRIADLSAPDEPVYSVRHAPASGGSLDATEFAAYFGATINNLPIAITATISGTEVSLQNDNHGTAGNVTITTSGTTNASVSGMSGGAAEGGGPAVAKRLKISARQIAISGSGGLSGSADGKSALMLDIAGLSAASIAQSDVLAFGDADDSELSNRPKKITFSNFEDAIFGNVSGDATVAAGGALTIAADAVEGSMLNDNVISGQSALGSAAAAQADELLFSDDGTLKKITFSNLEDSIFGNVSGDIAVAAGGAATIQADAVESGMLNDNVISGQTALGGASAAQADELLFSDGGTLKKITFSNLEDSIFGNLSADLTVAAGGAVTMAAAQTNITSLLATDIKIGEDDQTKIDFGTVNQISFFANNNEEMTITDDGVVIAGNLTVNGSTTTVDTTHLLVEDSLIEIARGDGTNGTRASNAGAGIYISGSVVGRDVSLTVASDGGRLRASGSNGVGAGFDIAVTGDYAIAGTQVLSADGAVKVQSGVAGAGLGHSAGVLSLDIDELSALGGTGVAQGDHFVFSDGGTEKKITFSNMEDAIFGNVSSQATIAAGGALSLAAAAITGQTEMTGDVADADEFMISDDGTLKRVDFSVVRDAVFADVSGDATVASGGALTIASDAVESGMLNDNVISGQTELAQGSLAAADELMISDGGTLKKFGVDSLAKDMLALTTEAAIANGDYLVFLDGSGTGETKKEAVADLATLFAGSGLSATDSVLAVDLNEVDAGTIAVGSDSILFLDADDSGATKKESVADLASGMAGAGIQVSSGVLSVKSRQDVYTLTASIALSGSGPLVMKETPATTGSVMVFFNGILQTQAVDYSLGGTGNKTISLKGANTLAAEDEVVVKYIKS